MGVWMARFGVRAIWALTLTSTLSLILALAISGCASKPDRDDGAYSLPASGLAHRTDHPAELILPAAALADDLLLQQRITIRWEDGEESFDSVLQKRGSTLVLMGLGPMNRVGFVLSLDDGGVQFENRSGREMQFRPERILADVQRVFYPWLAQDSACFACERREIRGGLEIRERIGAEFLEERRFALVAQPDRGEIVIRYSGWRDWHHSSDRAESEVDAKGEATLVAQRVVMTNAWFDYELTVETMAAERIGNDSQP